jgi:hypothetical protein
MKNTHTTIKNIGFALAATAALACGDRLAANDIAYSNLPNTAIVFDGASGFSFSNTGGDNASNIQVTGSTTGSAIGLHGEITGNYLIGAINHSGMVSSATVSGNGTISINDGTDTLTADLVFDDVVQEGTGSTLNDLGQVNLTNITYSGSNADLVDLKNAMSASNVLDFTFTPAMSLSQLAATATQTSFSGSISEGTETVPDNASTAVLFGLGAVTMVLGAIGQRRKVRAIA